MRSRRHAGPRTFVALATACALASLLALGAGAVPALDLASHFRVQYLAGLAPAIVLAAALRMPGPTVVLVVAALVHGVAVARAAWPVPEGDGPGVAADATALRVVTSNLLTLNLDHAAQVRWLASIDPDIAVFQEYTPAWHRALSDALDGLPHRHAAPIDSPFGVAIYSRWPIVRRGTPTFDHPRMPSASATLDVDGTLLKVIGTHPPPPLGPVLAPSNGRHVRALAAHVADLTDPGGPGGPGGPVIVAGDLNLTPWSAAFRSLVRTAGLRDARRGRGVLATWSPVRGTSAVAGLVRSPLTSLPLDHVLVGGGIDVEDAFVGEATGSDHRGFVADVRLPR